MQLACCSQYLLRVTPYKKVRAVTFLDEISKAVTFLDEISKNATGKIRRKDLRLIPLDA